MNHPLNHMADHGHTLIGQDRNGDYHIHNDAGDAVGGGLRKEPGGRSGVDNGNGSNMRRTIQSLTKGASASSMANGPNNEHSRRGSKHDVGLARQTVLDAADPLSPPVTGGAAEAPRTSPFSTIEDLSADTEGLQVTRGRAVQEQDLLDPFSPEGRESDPPLQQRRTSIVRQHVRVRTISTPPPPRSKTLEFLSDMGPLEISHKLDSGVHLGSEHEQEDEESTATLRSSTPQAFVQDSTADHASSYAHVSDSSQSSQSTAGESSSTMRTTDKETEEDGAAWEGKHPLHFTAEPEPLDDDGFQPRDATPPPSYVQGRKASLHHTGQSMGPEETDHSPQEFSANTESPRSGDARRRRTASNANAGKDLGHGRSMTESVEKRVIIHQVALTDTLAGIALLYGIQVNIVALLDDLTVEHLWAFFSKHMRWVLIRYPFSRNATSCGQMILSILADTYTSRSRSAPWLNKQESQWTRTAKPLSFRKESSTTTMVDQNPLGPMQDDL